jgi:nucleoside phosphorylase
MDNLKHYGELSIVLYTPSVLNDPAELLDPKRKEFAGALWDLLKDRAQRKLSPTKGPSTVLHLTANGIQRTVPREGTLDNWKKWRTRLGQLSECDNGDVEILVYEETLPSVSLLKGHNKRWTDWESEFDIWLCPRVSITKHSTTDGTEEVPWMPYLHRGWPEALDKVLSFLPKSEQPTRLREWINGNGKEYTFPIPTLALLSAMPDELQYYRSSDLVDPIIREQAPHGDEGNRGYIAFEQLHGVYLPKTSYGRIQIDNTVMRIHKEFPEIDDFVFIGCAGGDSASHIGDIVISSEILDQTHEYVNLEGKATIREERTERWDKMETLSLDPHVREVAPNSPNSITLKAKRFPLHDTDLYRAAEKLYDYQSSESGEWRRCVEKYLKRSVQDIKNKHQEREKEADELLANLTTTRLPLISLGRIWSSDHNVNDLWFRDQLMTKFEVKAVEMEGGGLARAAYRIGKKCIEIRAISDNADGPRRDDLNQPIAFAVASACLEKFLKLKSQSKKKKTEEP